MKIKKPNKQLSRCKEYYNSMPRELLIEELIAWVNHYEKEIRNDKESYQRAEAELKRKAMQFIYDLSSKLHAFAEKELDAFLVNIKK